MVEAVALIPSSPLFVNSPMKILLDLFELVLVFVVTFGVIIGGSLGAFAWLWQLLR
jgi:hypothetical protein